MTCRSGSESGRKMTPPLFCGSGIWKGKKPRYYRDNMKLLLHVISEYGKETVIAALRTCLEKNIYNSLSVQEISGSIHRSKDNMNGMTFQAPTSIPETADCHPEKTDINQYNKFFE